MKTSHVVTLLTIIGTIGVSSCSKKADDIMPVQPTPPTTQTPTTPTPTTPTATTTAQTATGFRVKIDGQEYAPDLSYALASDPGKDSYFAIYGLDSKTSDVVFLALPNNTVEGTYPISNVYVGAMRINQEEFSTVNDGTGTVTITKRTATNLVGTFSFTAYDATSTKKRTLTEGTFDVQVR